MEAQQEGAARASLACERARRRCDRAETLSSDWARAAGSALPLHSVNRAAGRRVHESQDAWIRFQLCVDPPHCIFGPRELLLLNWHTMYIGRE